MVREGEVLSTGSPRLMAVNTGQAVDRPPLYPPKVTKFQAQIKVKPEDWQVTEEFDAGFTGAGEHGYFFIEKRCLSTVPVAAWLAKQFDVSELDVGYAGMKDKHALTRQWFSVRLPGPEEPVDMLRLERTEGDERIKVLAWHRHQRKLRRGEHQANRFQILLRAVAQPIDTTALTQSIEMGFPNYFGPQRFGRHNLGDALHWLNHRRDRRVARGSAVNKRLASVCAAQLGVQRALGSAGGRWQLAHLS